MLARHQSAQQRRNPKSAICLVVTATTMGTTHQPGKGKPRKAESKRLLPKVFTRSPFLLVDYLVYFHQAWDPHPYLSSCCACKQRIISGRRDQGHLRQAGNLRRQERTQLRRAHSPAQPRAFTIQVIILCMVSLLLREPYFHAGFQYDKTCFTRAPTLYFMPPFVPTGFCLMSSHLHMSITTGRLYRSRRSSWFSQQVGPSYYMIHIPTTLQNPLTCTMALPQFEETR